MERVFEFLHITHPNRRSVASGPAQSKYPLHLRLDRAIYRDFGARPRHESGEARRLSGRRPRECLPGFTSLERGPERPVHLRLGRAQDFSIGKRDRDAQAETSLEVELQPGVDIQLRSRRSHDRVCDVSGAADSIDRISRRRAEGAARLTE